MRIYTVSQLKTQLQALADQVGAARYEGAKALVLDGAVITDADGNVLSPDQIDYTVTIAPAVAAAAIEPEASIPTEAAAAVVDPAKAIVSEVRKALAESAAAATRKVVIAPVSMVTRAHKRLKHLASPEQAFRLGRWVAACAGNRKAAQWCESHGVIRKAHSEGTDAAGGYIVPEEFEAALITLRESYGVFRTEANNKPMSRDVLNLTHRSAGLAAYFPGEVTAGTESTNTLARVTLTAKKAMVLSTISNELSEDASIDFGDDFAGEIAYAFAKKEDECGFAGDGTGTYGSITGVPAALDTANGTNYTVSGVVRSASTALDLSTITLTEMRKVIGRLPAYADQGNAKWYIHKSVANQVMERLAESAGGVTANEVRDGKGQMRFMGYPVVMVQALPSVAHATIPFILFGDLRQAAYFGDRRETSISFSDSALNAFEQDELAVRGVERFAITVAHVGSTTEAGAIVGLVTTS